MNIYFFIVNNNYKLRSNALFKYIFNLGGFKIMSDNNYDAHVQTENAANTTMQLISRFIVAAIILGVTAFFTPGFEINSIWTLAFSAVVLTVLDYLIAKFTGIQASPFGKGFVGFVLSVVILYVTQYFVAGYSISWMAAIIGALIYGIVDYIIPGEHQL